MPAVPARTRSASKEPFPPYPRRGRRRGVEATWTFPDEKVWGVQAKFFEKLAANEKAQLSESVRQAAANYPALERYTICLPFTLTAKKGAKAGKPKSGQHETLSSWIAE